MKNITEQRWVIAYRAGTWSIRTESGHIIAESVPHGSTALYISVLHNKSLDTEDSEL